MTLHQWAWFIRGIVGIWTIGFLLACQAHADVQPGDVITKDNMDKAGDLLIPTIKWFVQNGLEIKVIPYKESRASTALS